MAIGITLPPRQAQRLRLPRRHAASVLKRQTVILKSGILRVASAVRMLWTRLLRGAKDLLPLRGRARQRQRAKLNAFERQYEDLVDLLCASAHGGVRPDDVRAYRRARAWMYTHYPDIERHVRVHWQPAAGSVTDPFQALFIQARLEDAINGVTGIDDLMRSRAALEAYRAELDAHRA